MGDPRALRFPNGEDDGDDARLAARLGDSYAAMPPVPSSQIETCIATCLAATVAPRRPARRWWWGAAAAAALVVTLARPWRGDLTHRAADTTAAPGGALTSPRGSVSEDASGAVHFELALPATARAVSLVGDFNGWDDKATPMVREGREWSARVTLPPGRHVYAFVVDGATWLVDPLAPQVPDAGYGPANAVIVDAR